MYNYVKNMRDLKKMKAYIEFNKRMLDPDDCVDKEFSNGSDGVIKSILSYNDSEVSEEKEGIFESFNKKTRQSSIYFNKANQKGKLKEHKQMFKEDAENTPTIDKDKNSPRRL